MQDKDLVSKGLINHSRVPKGLNINTYSLYDSADEKDFANTFVAREIELIAQSGRKAEIENIYGTRHTD